MPSWYTSPATTFDAEGDGGDDRRLGAGVEALDVGGRVALGEPERLRLGERDAVVGALLGHLGEDEVRRAVDDAHHPPDRLAAQALAQRADERDAAGDRGLEQQVDAGVVGRGVELGADVGEQLLVRRDDGLALRERGGDELAGRLDPADDLDDEVDRRVVDHAVRVPGEHAVARSTSRSRLRLRTATARDLQAHAGAGERSRRLAALDQLHERGADVAAPEQTDPHELGHGRKAMG